jgi:hypothetical protein
MVRKTQSQIRKHTKTEARMSDDKERWFFQQLGVGSGALPQRARLPERSPMNKKYQIFVSSTYEDLKEERDQVVRAILEMNHIPVGMEMFSAADESQWKVIARTIGDCDYYILIIAHRYGSMDGKVSFTEKEYNFALKVGVPTLAFVIDKSAPWPADKMEKTGVKRTALAAFRQRVSGKLVTFWRSKDDLYAKVSIALGKQMIATPRIGWVRTSEASSEMRDKLSRLVRENEELRATLRQRDAESEGWFP